MMAFRVSSERVFQNGFRRAATEQIRGFKSSAAVQQLSIDTNKGVIVEITDPKIIAAQTPYVPSGERKLMEEPTRDLVNFPRPTMPLYPKPIRLWVIAQTWLDFFYHKTGVTGPYSFGIAFGTFLISKEYFVFEHDAPLIWALPSIAAFLLYMYGAKISAALSKEVDEEEEDLVTWQENQMAQWKTKMDLERKAQWQAKGMLLEDQVSLVSFLWCLTWTAFKETVCVYAFGTSFPSMFRSEVLVRSETGERAVAVGG